MRAAADRLSDRRGSKSHVSIGRSASRGDLHAVRLERMMAGLADCCWIAPQGHVRQLQRLRAFARTRDANWSVALAGSRSQLECEPTSSPAAPHRARLSRVSDECALVQVLLVALRLGVAAAFGASDHRARLQTWRTAPDVLRTHQHSAAPCATTRDGDDATSHRAACSFIHRYSIRVLQTSRTRRRGDGVVCKQLPTYAAL